MSTATLTRGPGRAYRERKPSQYDACPKCSQLKRTRAALCRACWKVKPRPRPSTNKHAGGAWARTNIPLAATCERCGKPAVDRHHIDGNPLNNDLANIASLCRRCHLEVDGRLSRFPRRKQSHCKYGHALSGANVYTYAKTGQRACRTCKAERDRRYRRQRQGRT